LQKIIKSINVYILKNKISMPYQIDAIVIKNETIEFIENISMF